MKDIGRDWRKLSLEEDQGVETLGLGESLTSGGYVRRADGTVLLPESTVEFMNTVAMFRDFIGKSTLDIATSLGNCDPAPAIDLEHGYVHTWSRLGYELVVGFGEDGRAEWIHEELGGPVSDRLLAAIEADAAMIEAKLKSVPAWHRNEYRAQNANRLGYANLMTPAETLRRTEEKLRLTEEQLQLTEEQLRLTEEHLRVALEALGSPKSFYGVSVPIDF
jgi:hypothetical protein